MLDWVAKHRMSVNVLGLLFCAGVAHGQTAGHSPDDVAHWVTPGVATAPSSSAARDPAAAEVLFRAGRDLLPQGKLEDAFDKFEESYRLDPTAGALLNLGECRNRQGRTASAWAFYQQAATLAEVQGKPDIYEAASQRQRELEPELSYLTIRVPHAVPGLQVKRDAAMVGAAQFDVALPMDPGRHIIAAEAPGYESIQFAVVIHAKRDRQTISIPTLKEKPIAQVASVAPRPAPAPVAASPASSPSPWPWLFAGVGGASLAVGTVSGLLAVHENNYAKDHCPTHVDCSRDVLQAQGRRNTEATVAWITLPLGAAALGTAVTWWLLAPHASTNGDTVSFGTFTNGHETTCWMRGQF